MTVWLIIGTLLQFLSSSYGYSATSREIMTNMLRHRVRLAARVYTDKWSLTIHKIWSIAQSSGAKDMMVENSSHGSYKGRTSFA